MIREKHEMKMFWAISIALILILATGSFITERGRNMEKHATTVVLDEDVYKYIQKEKHTEGSAISFQVNRAVRAWAKNNK
jgi:hypothetical protein